MELNTIIHTYIEATAHCKYQSRNSIQFRLQLLVDQLLLTHANFKYRLIFKMTIFLYTFYIGGVVL